MMGATLPAVMPAAPVEASILVETFSPQHASVAPQCCWSAWGDKTTCGGYPAGSSAGECNTDWTKACSTNADCPTIPVPPLPGPTPAPPKPSPHKPSPPLPPVPPRGSRGTELLGYIENWVNVKWWDNNIPGNCLMGCMEPGPYLSSITPYSAVNYGFAFLVQQPNPDQVGCGTSAPAGPCPMWDGESIYLAKADMQGSHLVDGTTTIESSSPGGIAIAEVVRMARQHPKGPKRAKITLGGWSDYARLATVANAQKAARLMAKAVQITFADGVDLDFEHMTDFDLYDGAHEFEAFAALISTLRTELDAVSAVWAQSATARLAALQKTFGGLQPWQKSNVKQWYATQFSYLKEVASNKPPHLEISWTTRFNAWVPKDDPYNYVTNNPLPAWARNSSFATDNEGMRFYANVSDAVDTINVMAYDATGLLFDYETIFYNFMKLGGVDLRKLNVGFEPGEQAASGTWEARMFLRIPACPHPSAPSVSSAPITPPAQPTQGLEKDENVTQFVKDHNIGGAMIWAANPSPKTNPLGAKLCPQTAEALNSILQPTYAWGPPPKYTKCDPSTGYLSVSQVDATLSRFVAVEEEEAILSHPEFWRAHRELAES